MNSSLPTLKLNTHIGSFINCPSTPSTTTLVQSQPILTHQHLLRSINLPPSSYQLSFSPSSPTLVHTDGLSAGVTVLGKHGIKAVKAEGSTIPHYVSLTTQMTVTLEAGEMLHVPRPALSLRALVSQDDLQDATTSYRL